MASRAARQAAIKRASEYVRRHNLRGDSNPMTAKNEYDVARLFGGPPAPGNKNTDWFRRIEELVYMQDFWYLAGPMSNLPAFNFPEFDRIAKNLRAAGYLISSPAEYEHEQTRAKIVASEDGQHTEDIGPSWAECLARDVCVVSHPNCVGVIVMDKWQRSRGALLETFVVDRLGKPIMAYRDFEDHFDLVPIHRDRSLMAHGLLANVPDAEDEAFADLVRINGLEGAR